MEPQRNSKMSQPLNKSTRISSRVTTLLEKRCNWQMPRSLLEWLSTRIMSWAQVVLRLIDHMATIEKSLAQEGSDPTNGLIYWWRPDLIALLERWETFRRMRPIEVGDHLVSLDLSFSLSTSKLPWGEPLCFIYHAPPPRSFRLSTQVPTSNRAKWLQTKTMHWNKPLLPKIDHLQIL